jgi:hypothetical protein
MEKVKYSPVYQQALKQLETSSAITTSVNELKTLYANKTKIESITELSVSGAGLKFTINSKDDAFTEFILTMTESINSKIVQKEQDIDLILNSELKAIA